MQSVLMDKMCRACRQSQE